MKTSSLHGSFALLILLFLMIVASAARPATLTWTNTAGGDWRTAVNWSPNQVPEPADTAMISVAGDYTVVISNKANLIVGSVFLGAATGAPTLEIDGSLSLNEATLGTAGKMLNHGIVTVGSVIAPTGLCFVTNAPGAQFNFAGAACGLLGADPNATNFYNAGTLTYTNTDPQQTGSMSLSGLWNSGSVLIEAKSSVTMNNQNDFLPGSFFSAGGSLTMMSLHSTAVFAGTINVVGPLVIGGSVTATFTGGGTFGGGVSVGGNGTTVNFNGSQNLLGPLTVSGGTVNFNGTGALAPASITLNEADAASAIGGGQALISGALTWTAGAISTRLQCDGGTVGGGSLGPGGQLINTGTMTWTGNVDVTGGGVVISNASSGAINFNYRLNSDMVSSGGGAATFYNAGLINVSGLNLYTAFIAIPFINAGVVNIESGALSLTGGASLTNGTINLGIVGPGHVGVLGLPGAANLAGTLAVTFNGYTPQAGDSLGLVSYGSESGKFTAFDLPPGVNWQESYGPTLFTLTAASLTTSTNSTLTWTNTAGGDWQTAANWNPNQVPGPADTAMISVAGDYTVVISNNANLTVGNIVLGATRGTPTLEIDGTLSFNEAELMNGGRLLNTGIVTVGSVVGSVISPNNNNSCFVTNAPGAQVNFVGPDCEIGGLFYNAGTLTYTNTAPLQTGTFYLSGLWNSGSVVIATNSALNINGLNDFLPGSLFSVGGGMTMTNRDSTDVFAGTIIVAGPLVIGGSVTATFNGGGTFGDGVSVLSVEGQNPTVNFNGSQNILGPLTLNGGTIGGDKPLIASGPLTWNAGTISTLVQCHGGSVGGGSLGPGGQLINTGTMTWTADIDVTGGGGVISNASTGVINANFRLDSDMVSSGGGAAAFYNAGQMNVSALNLYTVYIAIPFTNTGVVSIESGALSLTGAASLTNGTVNLGIVGPGHVGVLGLLGAANLAGALSVTFNGYVPQVGDSLGLVSYGSESGKFSSFALPAGVNWQETYGPTLFSLSVAGLTTSTNLTLLLGQPAWTAAGFNLVLSGPAGSNYSIQASSNLASTNWLTLTNFISAASLSPFTDQSASNSSPARWYRALMR